MEANAPLVPQGWEAMERTEGTAAISESIHPQVERILSDQLFHNSKRYSDLLRYIVDRTLEGKHECLKERIIGIEVFGRSPDYDTTVDSIVRGAAAEVRKRLTRYYQENGHEHELRIELPIRSYVAEFKQSGHVVQEQHNREVLALSQERTVPQEQGSIHQELSFWHSFSHIHIWIPIAAAILMFAIWGVRHMLAPSRAIDRFWAPMLNNSGPTLIAIGSPIWIKLSVPADATPRSAEVGISLEEFITHQVNFPIADLSAASAMTTFLGRRGKDSVIRLSDSTTLSDLHGDPLIVLGSFPNEWALRLGANLPFQFRHDGALQWIEDTKHPSDKHWIVNMHSSYDQVTNEYALITRAADQTTGQWWVGIGGVTVLGTLAGQQIMTDPKEIAALIAQLPKDWASRDLQVVIEIKLVKGSPGASRVVATRMW